MEFVQLHFVIATISSFSCWKIGSNGRVMQKQHVTGHTTESGFEFLTHSHFAGFQPSHIQASLLAFHTRPGARHALRGTGVVVMRPGASPKAVSNEYSGFRENGTISRRAVFMDSQSKGHLGVCAIYSETTV